MPAPWAESLDNDKSQSSRTPEPAGAKSPTTLTQTRTTTFAGDSNNASQPVVPGQSQDDGGSSQMPQSAALASQQESEATQQAMETSETTLDYIFGDTLPSATTTSNPSPLNSSPEQTDRSSGLATDRSLIQARLCCTLQCQYASNVCLMAAQQHLFMARLLSGSRAYKRKIFVVSYTLYPSLSAA